VHIKTAEQRTTVQQYSDWYTGRCWWAVGCYIWYREEGPWRGAAQPSSLIAVQNVPASYSLNKTKYTVDARQHWSVTLHVWSFSDLPSVLNSREIA